MSKKWEIYESSGDRVSRKNRFCPKCGPGVYLAKHADRSTCGKCGYTEFSKKPAAEEESSSEPAPAQPQKEKKAEKPKAEEPKAEEKPKEEEKPPAPAEEDDEDLDD